MTSVKKRIMLNHSKFSISQQIPKTQKNNIVITVDKEQIIMSSRDDMLITQMNSV